MFPTSHARSPHFIKVWPEFAPTRKMATLTATTSIGSLPLHWLQVAHLVTFFERGQYYRWYRSSFFLMWVFSFTDIHISQEIKGRGGPCYLPTSPPHKYRTINWSIKIKSSPLETISRGPRPTYHWYPSSEPWSLDFNVRFFQIITQRRSAISQKYLAFLCGLLL